MVAFCAFWKSEREAVNAPSFDRLSAGEGREGFRGGRGASLGIEGILSPVICRRLSFKNKTR